MKIFIDCCNYFGDNTNLGDLAVYQVAERRLRAFAPQAVVQFATFDPDQIERSCPSFTPFVKINRELASDPGLLATIRQSDAVFAIGGGCMSDHFASHAIHILDVLNEAARLGKPTALFSCGFEPVTNPSLIASMRHVLPKLGWISCREGTHGPTLLRSLHIPETRFGITGDDALESAHMASAFELGDSLGLGLRIAPYAGLDGRTLDCLRAGIGTAAQQLNVGLRPIPISLDGPSDLAAFRSIFADCAAEYDHFNRDSLPQEIRRCRVVVAGAYHAAVLALAQGIPYVGIAGSDHYRGKLQGLNGLLPEGGVVLDPDSPYFQTELTRHVLRLWKAAPVLRSQLLRSVGRLVERSRDGFKCALNFAEGSVHRPEIARGMVR